MERSVALRVCVGLVGIALIVASAALAGGALSGSVSGSNPTIYLLFAVGFLCVCPLLFGEPWKAD